MGQLKYGAEPGHAAVCFLISFMEVHTSCLHRHDRVKMSYGLEVWVWKSPIYMVPLGFGLGLGSGLRGRKPRAPGGVGLEMGFQQEWSAAKRTCLQEVFGLDNGLMTLLKAHPKLKFLFSSWCADCNVGVASGYVDKVLYFSFPSTKADGGNVVLLFPNLQGAGLIWKIVLWCKQTFQMWHLSPEWLILFMNFLTEVSHHPYLSFVSFCIKRIKFAFHFGPEAVIYSVVNLRCSKIRKACKSWDLF